MDPAAAAEDALAEDDEEEEEEETKLPPFEKPANVEDDNVLPAPALDPPLPFPWLPWFPWLSALELLFRGLGLFS